MAEAVHRPSTMALSGLTRRTHIGVLLFPYYMPTAWFETCTAWPSSARKDTAAENHKKAHCKCLTNCWEQHTHDTARANTNKVSTVLYCNSAYRCCFGRDCILIKKLSYDKNQRAQKERCWSVAAATLHLLMVCCCWRPAWQLKLQGRPSQSCCPMAGCISVAQCSTIR